MKSFRLLPTDPWTSSREVSRLPAPEAEDVFLVAQSPQGGAPTLTFETHDPAERAGSVDAYRWDGRNFALLNKSSMAYPPVNGPDREYQ